MRTLVLLLATSLGGAAFAGTQTAADISARCPKFKTAADRATCETAAEQVAKLAEEHRAGDVGIFLDAIEGSGGQLVLARKRAKHMRTWELIQRAEKEDVVLEGKGSGGGKGGASTGAKETKSR